MGAWQFDLLSFGAQFFLVILLYLLSLYWVASLFTYKYLLLCSVLILLVDIPLILKVYDILDLGGFSFLFNQLIPAPVTGIGIICFFIGVIGIVLGVGRVFVNQEAEF
jgi:hypothetical protein